MAPHRATCCRCISPTTSTRTERFTIESAKYELDLCEKHAQQFDREIGGWTRIAREVTPEVHAGRLEITRAREVAKTAVTERPLPRITPPADGTVVSRRLPPTYHRWSLSAHAHQRCNERQISQSDALMCASDPAFAYPHDVDPAKWIHVRGDVLTVVNPSTYEVVTVMPRDYLLMGEPEVASSSR